MPDQTDAMHKEKESKNERPTKVQERQQQIKLRTKGGAEQ